MTKNGASQTNRKSYLRTVEAILKLHRSLRASTNARSAFGISGKQHAALQALKAGPLTVGGLSGLFFTGESATSELVGKLERDGLVQRLRSESDNRVVYVSITKKGRIVAEKTPLIGLPLLRVRLRDLDPTELQQITLSIERVLALLDSTDEK